MNRGLHGGVIRDDLPRSHIMVMVRKSLWFLLVAGLGAIVAISLTWVSQGPSTVVADDPIDDSVRSFMDLGTTTKTSALTAAGLSPGEPSDECVPCRQKGTEPGAVRVPSRPPPHPTDGDYERIAGRSSLFVLPLAAGTVKNLGAQPKRGWLMVLRGLPVTQTNCFVEVVGDDLRLSRFSGSIRDNQVVCSLTGPMPAAFDSTRRALIESARALIRLSSSTTAAWSRGDHVDGFVVASVAPASVHLVPEGTIWTPDAQDDVHMRLQPDGRIIQMERVQAQGRANALVALRVVWFPEYDAN